MTWTEERIELLSKLWTEGLSASQIAAELDGGLSRNAVISKAHRLRLTHGSTKSANTPRTRKPSRRPKPSSAGETSGQPAPALAPTGVDPQLARGPEETCSREDAPVLAQDLDESRAGVNGPVPVSRRVTIMELREAMCRWPLGDPTTPEFRFCGARANEGLPYCAHHAQVAYQPAIERKRLRA